MKYPIVLAMLMSGAAFAGSPAKSVIAPPPEPTEWNWFAGASVGRMDDLHTELYALHVGVDTPWQFLGCRSALYLEAGWASEEGEFIIDSNGAQTFGNLIQVAPLTLNAKLERDLWNGLHVYAGGGIGAAYVRDKLEAYGSIANATGDVDDIVFTAQLFAGVGYDLTEHVEVYGGVRWMHFDGPDFGNNAVRIIGEITDTDLEDNVVYEVGMRYTF